MYFETLRFCKTHDARKMSLTEIFFFLFLNCFMTYKLFFNYCVCCTNLYAYIAINIVIDV